MHSGIEPPILLVKRAIQPGYGLWTLPAGYLEMGETAQHGAQREAREEAGITLKKHGALCLVQPGVDQPALPHVPLPNDGPGHETRRGKPGGPAVCPPRTSLDELAFRVVEKTLQHFVADREKGRFEFFMEDIQP